MILFNRELLEKLSYIMKIKGKSQKTIDCYINSLKQFFLFTKKQSKDISKNDFINYLKHITKKDCSQSRHNQFINAWRLYLKEIHNKNLKYGNEYRPKKHKRLPKVLSEQEILNGINSCKNIKHKAILATLFSTGMRRSELINLKVRDIDSKNMIIRIRGGKGFKDRNVPLTDSLLTLLRDYYRLHKPIHFLFQGTKGKYSATSLSNITKKYLNINPHGIRHSRGTNLINNGADITEVQKYFGHASCKTSQIYIHVSVDNLKKLHDPLQKAV